MKIKLEMSCVNLASIFAKMSWINDCATDTHKILTIMLFYEFNSKAWFAIAYCINVYMLESERRSWARRKSGKEGKKKAGTRFYIHSRLRGTRRRLESRRRETRWVMDTFAISSGCTCWQRLEGKGRLLYWIGLHDLRYRLPISLDHRSLSRLTHNV